MAAIPGKLINFISKINQIKKYFTGLATASPFLFIRL